MNATSLDLDAYFKRIEYGGATRPTLDTLSSLLRAHMTAIPFENLDVLLGRPVRLDLEGLQSKLVTARRGGYCFEHATLFAAVLEQLGFQPMRHAARVVLVVPRTESPRGHMFLTVPLLEGNFVVDPGFGGLASRVPLPLEDGQAAAGATHAIVRDGHDWVLRAQFNGKMTDGWVSRMERENPVDFEMGNHFTATHPSSQFRSGIMLNAFTADGQVSVMNRGLTIRRADGIETTQLAGRAALRALLVEHFGFDLPEIDHLRIPAIPEWDFPEAKGAGTR